jgi:hypothetical protein
LIEGLVKGGAVEAWAVVADVGHGGREGIAARRETPSFAGGRIVGNTSPIDKPHCCAWAPVGGKLIRCWSHWDQRPRYGRGKYWHA